MRYAPPSPAPDGYPFGLALVRSLTEIAFETPVKILVGENGTGKSTLLEALAAAADLPAISASEIAEDATLEPAHDAWRTAFGWCGAGGRTGVSSCGPRTSVPSAND